MLYRLEDGKLIAVQDKLVLLGEMVVAGIYCVSWNPDASRLLMPDWRWATWVCGHVLDPDGCWGNRDQVGDSGVGGYGGEAVGGVGRASIVYVK